MRRSSPRWMPHMIMMVSVLVLGRREMIKFLSSSFIGSRRMAPFEVLLRVFEKLLLVPGRNGRVTSRSISTA